MRWIVLFVLCVAVAYGLGLWRFASAVRRLDGALSAAPGPAAARPPEAMRAFALRGGADPDALAPGVVLTQAAEMRLKRGGAWQPLDAWQRIATGAAGFAWVARQRIGPLPKVGVIDSVVAGKGQLQVWLLGAFRIADATGPDMDEGEALRYLAELPWAPDAILGNPDIAWSVDGDRIRAALGKAAVTFTLSGGDVVAVEARARPATGADGQPTRMDWRGVFFDYATIGGRRIPLAAEVGYVWPDGVFEQYFRCRITAYAAGLEG